jgi:DNA-binding transcriptional LysR family regulator
MQLFVRAGLAATQPKAISGSAQFIKSLVLDSDFLAYLPRILTQAEESAGLMVALPVAEATWKRDVHILRRTRGSLAPGAQALLNELRQVCGRRRESKVSASLTRRGGRGPYPPVMAAVRESLGRAGGRGL